jgi:metal-responsive CopG/Arc/MetJ family transcriptional regulator
MATTEKVTLTLPSDLMRTVRDLVPPRGQSKFVAEAIESFIEMKQRQLLREELIAGYQATAEDSLAITKEWEPLDDEAWLLHLPPYEGEEPVHDAPDQTR